MNRTKQIVFFVVIGLVTASVWETPFCEDVKYDPDWPVERKLEYIRVLPRLEEIDGVTAIRGIPFRDLTNRDGATRSLAYRQLLESSGTAEGDWDSIAVTDQEKYLLFEMVRRTVDLEDNPNDTSNPRLRISRALPIANELCTIFLSRIEDRRILAYVLTNQVIFDGFFKTAEELWFARWQVGEKASFKTTQGVALHGNNIIIALCKSKALTPELLADIIAAGEIQFAYHPDPVLERTQRVSLPLSKMEELFTVASGYILYSKLEDRSRETGMPVTARDIPVREDGPGRELALRVQEKAEEFRLHFANQ